MRASLPALSRSLDRYLETATDTDALRVRKSVVPRVMMATLVPAVFTLCTVWSSDVAQLYAGLALWQVVM
ncbi:hypothetical protein DIPPA_02012 [Diplonema papillatum]|nr:hypothetical protein DIPPA_02012 [Diplonema papillatum]